MKEIIISIVFAYLVLLIASAFYTYPKDEYWPVIVNGEERYMKLIYKK